MTWLGRLCVTLTVLLAGLLVACGGDDNGGGSQGGSSPAPSAGTQTQVIEMQAIENGQTYSFSPNQLSVRTGDVVLRLINAGGNERPHTFSLKRLSGGGEIVNSDQVQPGQTAEIRFTVSEAGTYEFLCYLRGHADRGQTGRLVVSNPG